MLNTRPPKHRSYCCSRAAAVFFRAGACRPGGSGPTRPGSDRLCWLFWAVLILLTLGASASPAADTPEAKPDAPAAKPDATPAADEQPVAAAAAPRVKVVADQAAIIEQEPFDQITLTQEQGGAVLQVRPLDLPDRRIPDKPEPRDKLTLRLLDTPEKVFEVEWQYVAKVELFESVVLARAVALVKAGRFDDAYEHFLFLTRKYPQTAGLKAAYNDFLAAEAEATLKKGRGDAALVLLRQLHQRDPQRAGLEATLAAASEQLIQEQSKAGNFAAARKLLRSYAAWYPKDTLVERWEDQWKNAAGELLGSAHTAADTGQWRTADTALRRLEQIWPQLAGAKELAQVVQQKYPRLIVGVSASPAGSAPPGGSSAASPAAADSLWDWRLRQTQRLNFRLLAELAGSGAQGGQYVGPLGDLELDAANHRLLLKMKPDLRASIGEGSLTGYDAAQALAALADPGSAAAYRPDWAGVLGELNVRNVFNVEIALRRYHPRPEAFLQTAVLPGTDPTVGDLARVATGPYLLAQPDGDDASFLVNPRYPASPRPAEIVQRLFGDVRQAVTALQQGRIQVLDRVPPWEVKALAKAEGLRVTPYAFPLVHCLIPNLGRPLAADRTFRRAVLYGINREALLTQLCGGPPPAGSGVVSGPLPRNRAADDSLGYAYDDTLAPRPYDPRLALVLAQAAVERLGPPGLAEKRAPATLLLAHPADAVARTACGAIRSQLRLAGLNVTLQEIAPGASPPAEADLIYAELAVWEPVVDARRILGADGLTGGCTPHMAQALREVEQAGNWSQVRNALRQVHRVAFAETAVIPLWQLDEYFAYHESLTGVSKRPVTLYDDVERWRLNFSYPAE